MLLRILHFGFSIAAGNRCDGDSENYLDFKIARSEKLGR
jgi:hypothetical protein